VKLRSLYLSIGETSVGRLVVSWFMIASKIIICIVCVIIVAMVMLLRDFGPYGIILMTMSFLFQIFPSFLTGNFPV
jgi:hypothetical protein